MLCLINQTTLPLGVEQFIPERDVAFAVNALIEAMSQILESALAS